MKNLDKLIYRLILKTNFLLLILVFLIYPFKKSLGLSFLNSETLIILTLIFFSVLGLGAIISLFNLKSKKRLLMPNISYYLLYHILYPIIHKLFNSQSEFYQKYSTLLIQYNNTIQSKKIKKMKSSEILILLPHCLQNADCPFKITYDINNCHECGKCVIQDFKSIQSEFGVTVKVATGGTLARKIIKDIKPKLILAVACHRDLTEGIKDIDVIPVLGVLNERPNGPCFNTSCDVAKIRELLTQLL